MIKKIITSLLLACVPLAFASYNPPNPTTVNAISKFADTRGNQANSGITIDPSNVVGSVSGALKLSGFNGNIDIQGGNLVNALGIYGQFVQNNNLTGSTDLTLATTVGNVRLSLPLASHFDFNSSGSIGNAYFVTQSTSYATGTASQTGTTITGTGTAFDGTMVGGDIVYANGSSAGIIAFTDATHLVSDKSQSVAGQAYTIYYKGVQFTSAGTLGAKNIVTTGNVSLGGSTYFYYSNIDNASYYTLTGISGALQVNNGAGSADTMALSVQNITTNNITGNVNNGTLNINGIAGLNQNIALNPTGTGVISLNGTVTSFGDLIMTANGGQNIDLYPTAGGRVIIGGNNPAITGGSIPANSFLYLDAGSLVQGTTAPSFTATSLTGATASTAVLNSKVTADTQQRFIMNADGAQGRGTGAAAQDIWMARSGVGALTLGTSYANAAAGTATGSVLNTATVNVVNQVTNTSADLIINSAFNIEFSQKLLYKINALKIDSVSAVANLGFAIGLTTDTTHYHLEGYGDGTLGWGIGGSTAADIFIGKSATNTLTVATSYANAVAGTQGGTIKLGTVSGIGFGAKEGTNAKQGTATLSSGAVVVSNTSVTANSRILLTAQDNNCVGALRVSARTAGTSFTITSSTGTDTCVAAYEIFEPG